MGFLGESFTPILVSPVNTWGDDGGSEWNQHEGEEAMGKSNYQNQRISIGHLGLDLSETRHPTSDSSLQNAEDYVSVLANVMVYQNWQLGRI